MAVWGHIRFFKINGTNRILFSPHLYVLFLNNSFVADRKKDSHLLGVLFPAASSKFVGKVGTRTQSLEGPEGSEHNFAGCL